MFVWDLRPTTRNPGNNTGNGVGLQVGIADDQAKDFDFEKTEMKYDSTGMFHWSPARNLEDCILVRTLYLYFFFVFVWVTMCARAACVSTAFFISLPLLPLHFLPMLTLLLICPSCASLLFILRQWSCSYSLSKHWTTTYWTVSKSRFSCRFYKQRQWVPYYK